MTRFQSVTILAACAALLAACEKKAEGQVAAVVNGEEITLREVNGELGGQQVPEGVAANSVRQAALQRIIQRRLVAQAAKQDGLDKSPEYLIRRRALDDALLVQLLAQKIGSTIKVPAPGEIDAFIKSRPEHFANRSILTVDRIQFMPPTNAALTGRLEAAHTMDEIANVLKESKIAFSRTSGELDTARLNPAAARQIMALPTGEPFIMPQAGLYTAGVVLAKRPAPITGDDARPIAVNAMRNEQLTKAVERRLKAAMGEAKIAYQPGYGPPKEGAGTGKRPS